MASRMKSSANGTTFVWIAAHEGGHYKVHDLENIGTSDLNFITVEFLDSANKPLPVPAKVRL